MKPLSLLKAVFLPLIEPAVLFPMLMFWVFVCIGTSGSPLGIVVLILSLPPVFRFQMIIVEATAKGTVPRAFDAEFFNWRGNMWSLFPLPIVLGLIYLAYWSFTNFGNAGLYLSLAFAGAFLPASFAVLAITHSPLQSLNPVAIVQLLKSSGETFWLASVYLVLVGWGAVQAEQLPNIVGNFVQLFVLFSFGSLIGTLIEPFGLVDDIRIPDAVEDSEDQKLAGLQQERMGILTHAYSIISRGNRESGFNHIMSWIEQDPDLVGAWAWFFEQMMRWEHKEHAMFFAQHYVRDLLRHGENIPALKVTMRCQLVNEQFHPFREDLPALIEVAESSGNIELAAVLKRV